MIAPGEPLLGWTGASKLLTGGTSTDAWAATAAASGAESGTAARGAAPVFRFFDMGSCSGSNVGFF
jgi:hypothetical protein